MKRNLKDYKIEIIPTGLPQFDGLLGVGGYPKTFLTMISGAGGVGKTTIAAQGILEAQKRGEGVLYVETDNKLFPPYLQSLGVDFGKITILQCGHNESGEQILSEMLEELETGKYGFCVVDTVSKITTREEMEKDLGEASMATQARLIKPWLRKLKTMALYRNVAVLLLNHERVQFMNNNKVSTPGGEAIQEDVIVWVRLSFTGDYIASGVNKIGKKIKARIWRKNQVAATEGKEVILSVMMGKGFSPTADLMQAAIEKGVITKEGGNYYFAGEKVAFGQPKLRAWVNEHQDELKAAL